MPAGRPSAYDPEFCETVIDLGKEGKSQVQIACALDVDPATIRRWADANEEFRLALTRAKAEEQNWWENTGQSNLNADKFNSAVWSKSMSARFRDDYTERRQNEHSGPAGGPIYMVTGAKDELTKRAARFAETQDPSGVHSDTDG